MATIYHQVGIKAPMQDVYRALSTTEGISGWWTKTTGSTNKGGGLLFDFSVVTMAMEVVETRPGQGVSWKYLEGDGEWKDTLISFDLEDDGKQIKVNFAHSDWEAPTELFAHCCTKWAVFLVSLKQYVETGQGRPAPNDIQINHD